MIDSRFYLCYLFLHMIVSNENNKNAFQPYLFFIINLHFNKPTRNTFIQEKQITFNFLTF